MRCRDTLIAVAGLLSGVLGLSVAAAPSAAAGASPADNGVHTFLTGTVALSRSDAWTVGWGGIGSSSAESESLHWNGKRWVFVQTASEGGILDVNGLDGVAAISPSNIWAVGWVLGNCLIEHYNGRKWANVPCPYHGILSQLNSVSTRGKSDAWAVGFVNPGSNQLAFTEHWNGRHWAQVKAAQASGSFIELNSVVDLGKGNSLAVGDYQTTSRGHSVRHELAEHWNGTAWRRVAAPSISTGSVLMGVSGTMSTGVTAVGFTTVGGHNVPLIERWTGTRFTSVTQPVKSGAFAAVTVLSRTNAYAVGETGASTTLVEHYDGKRWTEVPTPNPSDGGYLSSVTATASGFVEASGWHGPDPDELPLIEQRNGRNWSIARQ